MIDPFDLESISNEERTYKMTCECGEKCMDDHYKLMDEKSLRMQCLDMAVRLADEHETTERILARSNKFLEFVEGRYKE